MLDDEKMRIYTEENHCVLLYNKIKFYKGVPGTLVFHFCNHMRIYTRKYLYVFEKYHVKNPEKQGGGNCKGGYL